VLTSFSLQRLLMLAVAGTSVFILSFGPFIVNVSLRKLPTLQDGCIFHFSMTNAGLPAL